MATDWNPKRSWNPKSDWHPKSDWQNAAASQINLAEALNRLSGKKRGKGLLPDPPKRDGIGVARSEAVPAGAEPGSSGIASPLVEQAYTGSTYHSLVSSDGLFVFEFPDQTEYIDDDGAGNTITVKHRDPSA